MAVSRVAKTIWDATDGPDQDAAELAAYADGDNERTDWFNGYTYLEPLEATKGEVGLKTVAVDTHAVDGQVFHFTEDGEFAITYPILGNTMTGLKAIVGFAHAYADDGMELRPVMLDEVAADV